MPKPTGKVKAGKQVQANTASGRWVTAVVGFGFAFGLAALAFGPEFNNDLGFHLRIGETTWQTRAVPSLDHYSFTAEGAPYLDQEWLSQLILYGAEQLAGVPGLVLFRGLVLLLAFVLLAIASKASARGTAVAAVLTICAIVAYPRVQLRPHMFSWVLIPALLIIQQKSLPWLVVCLLTLWANLHASFLLALLMSLIWVAEQYHATRQGRWLMWGVAFIVAPMLNPYGPRLYAYVLQIHDYIGFVSEWQRYPLSSGYLWLLAGVLMLFGGDLLHRRQKRPFDILRLLLLAGLVSTAMRHGPDAMMFLAPAMAERLDVLLRTLSRPRLASTGVLAAVLASSGGGYLIATHRAFRLELDDYALPVAATAFAQRHNLEGNLFNDYNFGGYLLWKAPERRVFVDGRLEIYAGPVLDDYLLASNASPGWERVLRNYDIAYCMVRADREIAKALARSPDWDLAYFDYNAAVFLRTGSAPEVRRLRALTPWGVNSGPPAEVAIEEARYLVDENPRFFGGHKILAFRLFKSGDLAGARAALRRYLELRPEGSAVADTQELVAALKRRRAWP